MASTALIALVEQYVPKRPFCAQTKHAAHIRGRAEALNSPFLQLNPPTHTAWLILDIDREGAAYAWTDADLPAPTYVAINPENSHAHIGYALSVPVCTTEAARQAPLRYLAAIERAFIEKSRADCAFNGPLAKNPLHPYWRLWEPANAPSYELGYLAEFVELSNQPAVVSQGIGRNCDLFDSLSKWAYVEIRKYWSEGARVWGDAVRREAEALNIYASTLGKCAPLGNSEVACIARSVAKFVWKRFTTANFSLVQSKRGQRGAIACAKLKRERREQAVRKVIADLSVPGFYIPSMQTVSKVLNCSVATLSEGYKHLWTNLD